MLTYDTQGNIQSKKPWMVGANNHRWKGGVKTETDGYKMIWNPLHPHCDSHRYVHNAHLIAEKALGRFMPSSSCTHHLGNRDEDSKIVICQDHGYHMILHQRTRIVERGGNPNTQKICSSCGQIKSKSDFHKRASKRDGLCPYCKACKREKRNANGK